MKQSAQKITDLPNIGAILAGHLASVGIKTPEALHKSGSRDAFLKIRLQVDQTACLNMLYALEGAVQGIRWHQLDNTKKRELQEYFQKLG